MKTINNFESSEKLPQPQYRGIVILKDGTDERRNVCYGTSYAGDTFPLGDLVNKGLNIKDEKLPKEREYPVKTVFIRTGSNQQQNIYCITNENGWKCSNMRTGETWGLTGKHKSENEISVGKSMFFSNGAYTTPVTEFVAVSSETVTHTLLVDVARKDEKELDPFGNNNEFWKTTTIYDDFKDMLENLKS